MLTGCPRRAAGKPFADPTRGYAPGVALTAILDVDGTLVDTNYPHTLAWQRALRAHGREVPAWRIHRSIGMGGDKLVTEVADEELEEAHGDEIRDLEAKLFEELLDDVRPLPGAHALVAALREAGHAVVLASSARPEEVEHHIDLIEARDLADHWTSSGDVDETKPAPDLVQVALERADTSPEHAVMVGDTTWDCRAAGKAGVATIALLTGGFSNEELREAGAAQVFTGAEELLARIDETPFALQLSG